jgi:3-hydroxy-D-aspartate aldolase
MQWYEIDEIEEIDSPSLVLYEDLMNKNIEKMIDMVHGETEKLMLHVKTNKMPKVIERMISYGIHHFKASTIAEAELASQQNAKSVLIAHQLVGPKIKRFGELVKQYPKTSFSCLIDNEESLAQMNVIAKSSGLNFGFYIDINTGMNRSGIVLGQKLDLLLNNLHKYKFLHFNGLHAYDGHIHTQNFEERQQNIDNEFTSVEMFFESLKIKYPGIKLVSGGTPAFTSHLLHTQRICSPGTCVFWDWGYADMLPEQTFDTAVLIVTRVISKPTEGIITIDLGHKAVASENPINKRVKFLNLDNHELLSQSEEHGVLKVENWEKIKVGDVFYGIPYHICPTINLHDEVSVIQKHRKIDDWQITGRKRKINI